MSGFIGRRVLVTGSSRGAGLEIAVRLLDGGAQVILGSRDAEALELLRDTLAAPEHVRALAFDVTDDEGTTAAIGWCATSWGQLDAVVHAVTARVAFEPAGLTQDRFEQALRLVLSGMLNVVRAAAEAGVPRVVVVVPPDGYARKAVLGLAMSLASAWAGTRVLAASESELAVPMLKQVLDG